MPAISASAPGKIILFGEHAVVYDRPAIAVPVTQVKAKAIVMANPAGQPGEVQIDAPGIDLYSQLNELISGHPLRLLIDHLIEALNIPTLPALQLRITSNIPIAAGLGSGAAVSVAVIRALSEFLGHPLPTEEISKLAYLAEKIYHGTPSGIDNTVISYCQPIFFTRGKPFEVLKLAEPFTLIIADSGQRSLTAEVVADVRNKWQKYPTQHEKIFDAIGDITNQARYFLENGPIESLGPLMTTNHHYLQEMDISSLELDYLVKTAKNVGASGAKLSGSGRGGNMIALVDSENASQVAEALQKAGAVRIITTHLCPTHPPKE